MLGVVAVTIVETTPASASAEQAIVSEQSLQLVETSAFQATETLARLAAPKESAAPLPLPPTTIAPRSEDSLIKALEYRLRWTANLDEKPDDEWEPATTAAIRLFQAKAKLPVTGGADPTTVSRLKGVAGNGSIDPRCEGKGIYICVSKRQKVARYVRNGRVLREIDINIGPEVGDEKYGQYSSTRVGVNTIKEKSLESTSSLYGYSMPFWMQFDGGIGFHFSEYFSQAGYADTTMGCTTIGDRADAEWLFAHSPIGTTVVVYL